MKSTKRTLAILLFAVLALSVFSVSAFAKVCTHPNLEHQDSVSATCTTEGNREYWYCPDCGYYFDSAACGTPVAPENLVLRPFGHNYKKGETVPATCTTEGYTEYKCEYCKKVDQRDQKPPLGHIKTIQNAKDATCTENGYTGDTVCKVCTAVISTGETIPMTGHVIEIVNAKEATETEKGYTGDKVCKVCKAVIEKGRIIPEKGALTPDTPATPDKPVTPGTPVLPKDPDKADINAKAALTGSPALYKALRASIDFLVSFVTVILPGLMKLYK